MKKAILFLPLLNFLIVFGQTPNNDPHWELEWEDNFNSSIDATKWKVRDNYDHYMEKVVYIDDNVYIENGTLVCEIKNETYYCPEQYESWWYCARQDSLDIPYSYTSAWLETQSAYYVKFGYLEAKIKFAFQDALWPGFWTFKGNDTGAANDAEIDIAELLGELGPNIYPTNIHYGGDPYENALDLRPNNFSWDGVWHTYAVEWSPDKIIWYLDNCPVRTFANEGIADYVKIILGQGIRPLDPLTTTTFPQKMYVDYVKVYKLENDCNTTLNCCNYNFGTHDNKVKKKIIIGNGSCSNALSSGQNVFLRAEEGVYINENFTVPLGASLYIDVNECYE